MYQITYSKGLVALEKDWKRTTALEYESICKKESCFEVTPDDCPIRMYFDFDFSKKHLGAAEFEYREEDLDRIISFAKQELTKTFDVLYPDLAQPEFAVKKQSSPGNNDGKQSWKYSFHLIVHNFVMSKAEQKAFVQSFNACFEDYRTSARYDLPLKPCAGFKFWDESVYSAKRKMRSPHATKPGENRYSVISEGTFEQTIISCPNGLHVTYERNGSATNEKKQMKRRVKVTDVKANAVEENQLILVGEDEQPMFPDAEEEIQKCYLCFASEAKQKHAEGKHSIFDTHTQWNSLCQATRNVLGSMTTSSHFVDFSREWLSENKQRECQQQWNKHVRVGRTHQTPLTIGWLKHKARECDSDLYDELFYTQEQFLADLKTLSRLEGDADFAKGFKDIVFKEKQVLFTGEDKHLEGYIFNGVYWASMPPHDADIHKGHFDELYEHYAAMVSRAAAHVQRQLKKFSDESAGDDKKKGSKSPDVEAFSGYKRKLTVAANMIRTLKTHNMRNNIVKIFKKDNYVPNVEWNKNRDLFVFEDCVYDLALGEFRTGSNADEYIRRTCGYKYHISAEPDVIMSKEKVIADFFHSILAKEDVEYFLLVLSSFLQQANKEEKAYFWLGNGRNGKGTATTILRKALGRYWGELGIDYYTNHEKGVDRPNQSLYDCSESRVLNTSEIQDNESTGRGVVFIGDKFKTMTGGDPITARELGTKNRISYLPGHVLIQTNIMPSFTKVDAAITNRVVIINFPFEFTDDKDKLALGENYKPKNEDLKFELTTDVARRALIDILFRYHKQYRTGGLRIPDTVMQYTRQYLNAESFHGLLEMYCVRDPNAKIALTELRAIYTQERDRSISLQKLRTDLTAMKCKVTKRDLQGWKLKQDADLDVNSTHVPDED